MLEAYDVRRLPEAGETIEETLDASWLESIAAELGPDALNLGPSGSGEVSIRLRAVAGANTDLPAVRVTGRAKAPIHVDCVRCLSPVERTLEAELDLTLFPAEPEREPAQDRSKGKVEKVELSAEQLDLGSYPGFELDLPALVREALLLEVEMNPTCADQAACEARVQAMAGSAAGNPEGDEAKPGGIDPRWAPLQKFRLKSS